MPDDRDVKRIDGLLVSYGDLLKAQAVLEERVSANERTGSDALARFERALTTFDTECDKKVDRLTQAIHAQSVSLNTKIDQQAEKINKQAADRQWTPIVKAAVMGPTFASLIAAIALVVTKST